ncbi:polyprenyl synthetase family protein [Halobacillus sp. Marseille-Q1614]|uniref:polyprenyl synthetase family protein n=1 Tax=Halobacillus sp. Marseille-Q1614 TaxID=2709134 RepID=UPI0035300537
MASLQAYVEKNKGYINEQLEMYVQEYTREGRLRDAMLYSIRAGGKRLRPVLVLAALEAFGSPVSRGISTACALEMVHTYSLIHDDLPAMDNDDTRRGQPTNHMKFDEATAILAGDALLTLSFQVISEDVQLSDSEKVFLINELSRASGPIGMVNGQMLDMQSEDESISLEALEYIHKNKTGQLLRFSILAGSYLSGADEIKLAEMLKMAEALGMIFQIQDDILDVIGDAEAIGKPTGSDVSNQKSTYPQLLGLEGAVEQKERYVQIAQQSLRRADVANTMLSELIDYLSQRNH